MSVEAQTTVKFPGFAYRGFDIPALEMPASLIENLGTNKQAYELVPNSTPLAWRVALYSVGRDVALGEKEAEYLPESVRQAGSLVYNDAQERKGRGGWHKDGVLYLPRTETPKGMTQPKDENYVLARYFRDIAGFERKGDVWTIKPSPETREELIWIPEGDGAFAVPIRDGVYHPVTGTAFETLKSRDAAVKRWIEAGLTKDQAEKELSRNYRRSSGVAAVWSYSGDGDGPLYVDLDNGPWDRYSLLGSFPASRSAERSEAPKNSGFKLLTDEEFDAYEADRTKRFELEAGMRRLLEK